MLTSLSGAKEGVLWFYAAWRLWARAPVALTLLGLISLLTPQSALLFHQPLLFVIAHCFLILLSYLFCAGLVFAARAVDQGCHVNIGLLFEGQRLGLIGRIISVFCLDGALYAVSFALILMLLQSIGPDTWTDTCTTMAQLISRLSTFASQRDALPVKGWQIIHHDPTIIHFLLRCFAAMIIARVINLVWMLSLSLVVFNRLSLQQAYRVSFHTMSHHFIAAVVLKIVSAIVVYALMATALVICVGAQLLAFNIHGGLSLINILGLAIGFVVFLATYCFAHVFAFVAQYVVWKQLVKTTAEENSSIIGL